MFNDPLSHQQKLQWFPRSIKTSWIKKDNSREDCFTKIKWVCSSCHCSPPVSDVAQFSPSWINAALYGNVVHFTHSDLYINHPHRSLDYTVYKRYVCVPIHIPTHTQRVWMKPAPTDLPAEHFLSLCTSHNCCWTPPLTSCSACSAALKHLLSLYLQFFSALLQNLHSFSFSLNIFLVSAWRCPMAEAWWVREAMWLEGRKVKSKGCTGTADGVCVRVRVCGSEISEENAASSPVTGPVWAPSKSLTLST